MNRPRVLGIVQTITQSLLVVLLALLAVRIILAASSFWIPFEYRLTGFPPDRYGFSTEDRIFWSRVDVDFLLGDHDISYFDQYTLPNGEPMHNERELRHMQDVYNLLQIIWKVLAWGAVAAVLLLALVGQLGSLSSIGETLMRASRWTLLLMVVLGVGLVAAFGVFFVGFHRLLFAGDTWIFPYSDTFIRLYPEKFWRDTFGLVVAVTLLEAGLLYLLGRVVVPRLSERVEK